MTYRHLTAMLGLCMTASLTACEKGPEHFDRQIKKVSRRPELLETINRSNGKEADRAAAEMHFGLCAVALARAQEAWDEMGKSHRTPARSEALNELGVYCASISKAIKDAKRRPPNPADLPPQERFVGPDVSGEKPWVLDTKGSYETILYMEGTTETALERSRWGFNMVVRVGHKKVTDDDRLSVQVYQGDQKLGAPSTCKPRGLEATGTIAHFDCNVPARDKKDYVFKSSGEHTIKLGYTTAAGASFKDFATLRLNALAFKSGSAKSPQVDWDNGHDMKLAVTTVEEDAGRKAYIPADEASPFLVIRTWFKHKTYTQVDRIECMYRGKKVAEAVPLRSHKFEVNHRTSSEEGEDVDVDMVWEQVVFKLELMKPRPGANGDRSGKGVMAPMEPLREPDDVDERFVPRLHWLDTNPGEYRCLIWDKPLRDDGKVVKEVHFTVGEDGKVIKPPCQLASMNAPVSVTLARTVDHKVSDQSYDAAAGKTYGYHGRVKWAEGCPPGK